MKGAVAMAVKMAVAGSAAAGSVLEAEQLEAVSACTQVRPGTDQTG